MGSEHTTKAFDSDLQELTRLVAEMGGLAEAQLCSSIEAVAEMPRPNSAVYAANKVPLS